MDKTLKKIIRFHIFMFFMPFLLLIGMGGSLYEALIWGVFFSIIGLGGTVMEMDKINYVSPVPARLKRERDELEKAERKSLAMKKIFDGKKKECLGRMRSEMRGS
ncbi:MAG: hypothetical protein ACTSPB_00345 [Candidatus Thorarchaeota archaeon]